MTFSRSANILIELEYAFVAPTVSIDTVLINLPSGFVMKNAHLAESDELIRALRNSEVMSAITVPT